MSGIGRVRPPQVDPFPRGGEALDECFKHHGPKAELGCDQA
jgi:hypothetical protein